LEESIFTSAGVSAGIDLTLHIVSHFLGTEAGYMENHNLNQSNYLLHEPSNLKRTKMVTYSSTMS